MKTWGTKSGYKITRLLWGRSNVFLLTNGIVNILIDTSVPRNYHKLVKRLKSLSIGYIDYIILTHSHYDHAGNASAIKESFKTNIILQKDEMNYLKKGDITIPKGTNIFTYFITKQFGFLATTLLKCPVCESDIIFDAIFDLNEFGFDSYIIHTPGHSIGSSCVIVDNEIALVGDTMFGVFPWSVFPPFADDAKQMVSSWGKLLATNCSLFLPSHGREKTREQLKIEYNKRRLD
jgi:hydroxyacylglutathione hydrolase